MTTLWKRIETRRRRLLAAAKSGSGPESIPRREGFSPSRYLNDCTIALGLLVLFGAGSWLRDVTHPFKSATTLRAREFAQWFWFELAHDSELVSCETDLQTDLSPDKRNCGWSSLYFCNQRIYSSRHARGEKPHWERVSAERPLRCVLYRSPKEEQESPPPDPQLRQRWLESARRYDLVAHDAYPFAAYDKSDRQQRSSDYVEVFKFVPKGGSRATAGSNGTADRAMNVSSSRSHAAHEYMVPGGNALDGRYASWCAAG